MGCAQSGSKTPKGRDRRYLGTGDKGNRKVNKKDMFLKRVIKGLDIIKKISKNNLKIIL